MNIQGILLSVFITALVFLVIRFFLAAKERKTEMENLATDLATLQEAHDKLNAAISEIKEKYDTEVKTLLVSNADLNNRLSAFDLRYSPIISLDQEIESLAAKLKESKNEFHTLNQKYQSALLIYNALTNEIDLYRDTLEMSAYGLYEPSFNFEFPEQYLVELEGIYQKQKAAIKSNKAVICHADWELSGSSAEGKRMVAQESKLMLSAFNGVCNSVIANVKWNNIVKSKERISKSYYEINDLGATTQVEITREYLDLKQQELTLAYEYQKSKHERKEEQRVIREQMREEEKAQRELATLQQEAEEEAALYEKVLAKAREELGVASIAESQLLKDRIHELEEKVKTALEKRDRAISQAQLVKRGHIYVISNIGSFGENVFKIGMTRRLEPMERIRELSDAALPFQFDVHAIIFSEDATQTYM